MAHEICCFVFPSMPACDRRIVLDVGELLCATNGCYREHLKTEVRLLYDAACADGLLAEQPASASHCRVLPFHRPS